MQYLDFAHMNDKLTFIVIMFKRWGKRKQIKYLLNRDLVNTKQNWQWMYPVKAMDLTESFAEAKEGKWLADNAYRAEFIIRYLKGKETVTGYSYEPWHIRYVGDIAKTIYEQNITLKEYFSVHKIVN